MTQLLSDLLAEEAERIEVPEPRPAQIIRRSRMARLRRRAGRGAAVLTAAAVAATIAGVGLVTDGPEAPSTTTRQAAAAYDETGAFAVGSTVFVGGSSVDLGQEVKSVLYTSAGVLVRAGSDPDPDEGPSRYTLVRPDGSTQRLDLPMGDRVAATDPDSPYVAYLEAGADPQQWSFVVVDVRTGEEVARQADRGRFTWGGWEAPPATTVGTTVWGLFDDGWHQFDWSTGTVRVVPGTENAVLETAHGLGIEVRGRNGATNDVVDLATGETVTTVRTAPSGETLTLSPDGRHVRIGGFLQYDEDGTFLGTDPSRFVDLATGRSVEVPQEVIWGWTPSGQALAVDPEADEVTTCDPGTGACTTRSVAMGSGEVRLGGRSYGS